MMRAGWLIVAVLSAPACYRFVPETGSSPAAGNEYRAYLTEAGTEQLRPVLGQNVGAVDGRFMSVSDTTLEVSVGATIPRGDDPRPIIWVGERVVLPRSAIARMERRELDRPRTMRAAALYTVGVLAAGSIWLSIKGKASSRGDPGPITPPP